MADVTNGGVYLVHGELVDAWGNAIVQPQAQAVQPATEATGDTSHVLGSIDDYTLEALRGLAKGVIPGYTNMSKTKLWDALTKVQEG